MLVLSRNLGDKVTVGGGNSGCPVIEVTVVDIDRGKIRLGFTAPRNVPIYRNELLPVATDAVDVAG